MKTDYKLMKEIAKILNDRINYAEHHNKKNLDLLYDIVDDIAILYDDDKEKDDYCEFYWLCNVISPDQRDENAIS